MANPNAILSLGFGLVAGFPAGTAQPPNVIVTITGTVAGNTTPQSQTVAVGTATVTFTNQQADTYALSAQTVDANNAPVGPAVTGSLSLVAPATISLSLVTSISGAQG